MKETDKAWSAAIIEGEGHADWSPSGRRKDILYAYVAVIMSDEAVINKLSELFGGGVHLDKTSLKRGKKLLYRWAVNGRRASNVCRLILPYIIGEKRQIISEMAKTYKKYVAASGQTRFP